MATLLDIITHKGVHYIDLTEENARREVRQLAIKLWPLQDEINHWLSGKIDIIANGEVVTTDFSLELSSKIAMLSLHFNDSFDENNTINKHIDQV